MLPIVDWGKLSMSDGRLIMHVSVHTHHSFADGIHVTQFMRALQNILDK